MEEFLNLTSINFFFSFVEKERANDKKLYFCDSKKIASLNKI